MLAAAANVRARFLGLAPDSTAPSPAERPAVMWSSALIHVGISGSSPGAGRPRHCRTATARSASPNSSSSTSTAVLVPLSWSSTPPATSSTTTLTTTKPTTHPTAKAGPFEWARGVPSMRITATIGTGLTATPTAEGSRSPMASPSMRGTVRTRLSPDVTRSG
jgi:hypothetical protein